VAETGTSSYHSLIPGVERVLQAGIGAGTLIGLGAFVLALVDLRRQAAGEAASLRAIGASRRCVALSQGAQYGIGAVVVMLVGVASGWLAGASYLIVGATGARLTAVGLAVSALAGATLVLIFVVVFALAALQRDPDPSLLRRE
jgi:hypothetical protein